MKILYYNALFLAAIAIVFEVIFGAWFFDWPYHSKVIDYTSCKNDLTYWAYCPGQTSVNRMAPEDGGEWIDNHVNRSAVRVATAKEMIKKTDFDAYTIYLTGDSFIQSDEVDFDETVGAWIEKTTDRKTLQNGYSSWAAIQYMNYLTTIDFKARDDVLVFLNITDFSPHNQNSNHYWRQKGQELPNGKGFRFTLTEEELQNNQKNSQYGDWMERSIIVRLYSTAKKKIDSLTKQARGVEQYSMHDDWKDYEQYNDVITQVQNDCSLLTNKYANVSPALKDYLVYAFDEKCWPESFKGPYLSAMKDLQKLSNHVTSRGAKLHIVLFPMGWGLTNEGVISKQHPYYSMGPDAIITTLGVIPALERDLPAANILELETILNHHNSEAPNDLYFTVDSHWNAKAQKIIGEWLGNQLM
jgi:hypothetical protein